jgi:hypothetical protein
MIEKMAQVSRWAFTNVMSRPFGSSYTAFVDEVSFGQLSFDQIPRNRYHYGLSEIMTGTVHLDLEAKMLK